jgi:hypothetical protein
MKDKAIQRWTRVGDDHAITGVRHCLEHGIQGRTPARRHDDSVQRARVDIELFAKMVIEGMPQIQASGRGGVIGVTTEQVACARVNPVEYWHGWTQVNYVRIKRLSQPVQGTKVTPWGAERLARVVGQERPSAFCQAVDARYKTSQPGANKQFEQPRWVSQDNGSFWVVDCAQAPARSSILRTARIL